MKHNFPEHRYKHGKQTEGINLAQFSEMLEKVKEIELPKRMKLEYDVDDSKFSFGTILDRVKEVGSDRV